jgi:hypothetical protein
MKINVGTGSRAFLSLLLGAITVACVAVAEKWLPYSSVRDNITDAVSFPGFLIARIFYPEGVHTGGGAPNWGTVFLCSNVIFYGLLWFIILTFANSARARRMASPSEPLK